MQLQRIVLSSIFVLCFLFAKAQSLTIDPSNASAILQVSSTSKGIIIPKMTSTERVAISTPISGLLVYDTTTSSFWYYNGTAWTSFSSALVSTNKIQDSDANTKIETEQSSNENYIRFTLDGKEYFKMNKATIEVNNSGKCVYIGYAAGLSDAYSFMGIINYENTGVGANALQNSNGGSANAAVGTRALQSVTTGRGNSAIGNNAGTKITTGNNNTFLGYGAEAGSDGLNNVTAIGASATVTVSNSIVLGNNANVGIGTSAPTEKLEVVGKTKTTNFQMTNGASANYVLKSDDNGNASWANASSIAVGDNFGNHIATSNLRLGTYYLSNDGTNKGLSIDNDGTATFKGDASNVFNIGDGTNERSVMSFKNTRQDWRIGVGDGVGDSFTITDVTNDETPFIIGNNNTNTILKLNDNKVGVNNNNPSETLDVIGKTKTTNFQMTNGAMSGYVLQSDADGNASWVNLSSTNWAIDGSNQYSALSGNVGIGTSSPTEKLHVESADNANILSVSTNAEAGFQVATRSGVSSINEFSTYSSGNILRRWSFGKNDDAETGSNFGSDFYINRYDDNGTYLNRVMQINRATGYLGIGRDFTPNTQLHVSGGIKSTSLQTEGIKLTTNADNGKILLSDADGNASWVSPSSILTGYWTSTNTNDANFNLSGKVGIGKDAPVNKVDIYTDTPSINALKADLGHLNAGTNWNNGNNYAAIAGYGGNTSYQAGLYGYIKGTSANSGAVVGAYDSQTWGALAYRDANLADWGIYSSGSAKIVGTLTTTNFKMTSGASNGYILQSDANGNASWVSKSFGSVWSESGSNIYNNNSDYVGIGTTSPTRKLHVDGSTNQYIAQFDGSNTVGTWLSLKNTTTGGDTWSMVSTGSANGEGAGHFLWNNATNGTKMILTSAGNLGIGLSNPSSSLHVNGSISVKRTVYTTTATIGSKDHIVAVTTTSAIILTLPSASTSGSGREYIIKSAANSANITISTTSSQTIDGATSKTITTGYGVLRVYSDGSNWFTF